MKKAIVGLLSFLTVGVSLVQNNSEPVKLFSSEPVHIYIADETTTSTNETPIQSESEPVHI